MEESVVAALSSLSEPSSLVPITLLSGFLGSGKTTTLKHILENKEGLKICCVVNDVASINIDAKLVKQQKKELETNGIKVEKLGIETVELENGCICCSSSEELITSIANIIARDAAKQNKSTPEGDIDAEYKCEYDHIIIESTGVSEPNSVRNLFFNLEENDDLLTNFVYLRCMITVVDSEDFLNKWNSKQNITDRKDLGHDKYGANRQIVDLLSEQVECADIVLLNKQDRVKEDEKEKLLELMTVLNPTAKVIPTTFGKAPIKVLINKTPCMMACWDTQQSLKATVSGVIQINKNKKKRNAEKNENSEVKKKHKHEHNHNSKHKHDNENKEQDNHHHHTHDKNCSHNHHSEDHKGHQHKHDSAEDHHHTGKHKCTDAHCSHDHSSRDSSAQSRHKDRFGIESFVFTARRPFHAERLHKVLADIQAAIEPVKLSKEPAEKEPVTKEESKEHEAKLSGIVRSKGFVWIDSFHDDVFYWAHAGAHIQLTQASQWLDLMDTGHLSPEDMVDFQGPYGDRRQELVIIGVNMDQHKIQHRLQNALLTDAEFTEFKQLRPPKPESN